MSFNVHNLFCSLSMPISITFKINNYFIVYNSKYFISVIVGHNVNQSANNESSEVCGHLLPIYFNP